MAITALTGAFHTAQHDLESFFWVLVYLLVLPTDQKAHHTTLAIEVLEDMFAPTFSQASQRKGGVLIRVGPLPINPAYMVVAPFIQKLRMAVRRNFNLTETGEGTKLSYEAVLQILDEALVVLGDDKVNVMRVPAVRWKRPPKATHEKATVSHANPTSPADVPLPSISASTRSSKKARASVDRSRDLPTPRSEPQLPSSRGSTKRVAPEEVPEASAHLPKKKSRSTLVAPTSPPPSLRDRTRRRSTRLNAKAGTSTDT
jgi:hypothetical protein